MNPRELDHLELRERVLEDLRNENHFWPSTRRMTIATRALKARRLALVKREAELPR
jgi:hypothetical protein